MIDVETYLNRIGYRGHPEPNLQTLAELQLLHLRTVPFENLDIHLGRQIVLDYDLLFDKVVRQRRGGFCYELNGTFGQLLSRLGFRVTMLSAGVAHETGGFGPDFDHMTLRVDLDEPWLVDVGFGDSFQKPLRLKADIEQSDDRKMYRFLTSNQEWILEEEGKPQFKFTLKSRELSEFREMCDYHQTSPKSHFTQNRICSIATPAGRVSLSNLKLITTVGTSREEQILSSQSEYDNVLQKYFGMRLNQTALKI
ncbi:MAG: acetyltransferase [Acidobacteria bacterium]|nr:MAG: acetyltransferase [Acidobacteriota bacterium]